MGSCSFLYANDISASGSVLGFMSAENLVLQILYAWLAPHPCQCAGCCVCNVCKCSCASLPGCAGLHTEVGQMVREKWRSMLASCCHGTSYVPDKRLGQLLQQWGGDDEERVGQAEKEGGERERRLKVLGEDLTAEELKEVLQACLRDAHPSGQAEGKRRGGLIGCFRPRHHSKLASEEELDKAAQYVVARFGAYDNEDDDEEEKEGAEELEGKKKKEKGGVNDALLEKERDQLANALERLADVQRELAEGQRSLMTGQPVALHLSSCC
ncbi:TPA: hypothetical protein ACH3X1_014749 [Trebouxia sp. C0004]